MCGDAEAGKSTLAKTLGLGWMSGLLQRAPRAVVYGDTASRTAGIALQDLRLGDSVRFAVHDFAGHEEYHALHSLLLSQTGGAFLVVVRLNQPEADIAKGLRYWLRFIATRLQQDGAVVAGDVVVVGTCADLAAATMVQRDGTAYASAALNELVREAQVTFADRLKIRSTFVVAAWDARSSGIDDIKQTLREVWHYHTEQSEEQLPAIVEDVCGALGKLRPKAPPFLTRSELWNQLKEIKELIADLNKPTTEKDGLRQALLRYVIWPSVKCWPGTQPIAETTDLILVMHTYTLSPFSHRPI